MKHKIISIIAAVAMTCSTFGAVAQAPPIKEITLEQAINFCRVASRAFLKGDKGKMLNEGMERIDPSLRKQVAIICTAYGDGFDDGRVYINYAT